ncbi:hypothetical protein Ddye_021924 [Dipteronia dyeriana]|uniref:Retrotransposon gag domain-containing protein n=1 Tax=Dipteronia dyeriana TaxID=168575 RepID=A0AAD9U3K9_9ROSI|nr:hypothetical protein Ddye_021924 [Dipteronia dyeriana]
MTTAIQGGNRTHLQMVEQFRRLHPLSFEGTTNPLDAEEWLRELEKVFTFINCTDDQKVISAVFMLKGDAGHWWEIQSNHLARFREHFSQKYVLEELRNEKEAELIGLIQGSMSLVEYERKFEQLSRFAPYMIDTDQLKTNRFIGGLKPNIRKHVWVLGLRTYAEVLQKAPILAREDEIASNEKPKEKVQGPP